MLKQQQQFQVDSDATRAFNSETKILSLAELATTCELIRARGQEIVLCHGVFDLIHVGHVRHLKTAKRHGDCLVVTITADVFVNKGPDRPAFTADLRLEFLASLEFIDYVAVIEEPSATAAIEAVKPNTYVKGGEYTKPEDDITGKIGQEKKLVEAHGGQLIFTNDITFSSSNLLNKHFSGWDENLQRYLTAQREAGLDKNIKTLLEEVASLKVVMIGETIIDRYTYVSPMGKASKENIIATLHKSEEEFAGGVIATANHLAGICPNLELITTLGDPACGENFESHVQEVLNPAIKLSTVYRPNGPTVQKSRFVEPTYVRKLFEVYHMDDHPLPEDAQSQFHETLKEKIKDADVVIVNDFGHGLISPKTVDLLQTESKFLCVNAQSNAGNRGYNLITKYSKADFVCIDANEAWLAVQNKHEKLGTVVAERLPSIIDCPNIIVTHGKAGCYVSNGTGEATVIPAFQTSVADTMGAGDAFFALASPMLAVGADCHTAGFVGNVAGAITIGIVGHRRYLNKLEVLRYVTTLLK